MTRRRRVLVVSLHAGPEQTGNAPYVTSLASGLAAAGWSVRLLAAHPHYPQWRVRDGYGQWRRVDDEAGVRVERLKHYVPAEPTGMRRLLAEISFGVRTVFARWGRPDAVILVSPALISSALAMGRARLRFGRVPTVVWVQDLYSRGMAQTGMGGGSAAAVAQTLESAVLGAADQVVVIHERFRTLVVEHLDADPSRVDVVRNWSHLAGATPDPDIARTRATHGWADETVVVHGGNQGLKQGLENVVEAARLADERGAPIRFVLLGHGSRHESLCASAAGIQRLQFLGSMEDDAYTSALAAADVLLVNELAGVRDMAVPSKLTTYFRTGRPVLAATDDGSISAEEVARAGAGVRVDAGDPAALLDAALALGADRSHGDALGASGARFARENLEQAAAIDRFSGILTRLIERAGSR